MIDILSKFFMIGRIEYNFSFDTLFLSCKLSKVSECIFVYLMLLLLLVVISQPFRANKTKIIIPSLVMLGIAPLHTLLSPPKSSGKLSHFQSSFFFKQLARSIPSIYRACSRFFRVNLCNTIYCRKWANIRIIAFICKVYPLACKSYKPLPTSFVVRYSPQVSIWSPCRIFVIAQVDLPQLHVAWKKYVPSNTPCISKRECQRFWLFY